MNSTAVRCGCGHDQAKLGLSRKTSGRVGLTMSSAVAWIFTKGRREINSSRSSGWQERFEFVAESRRIGPNRNRREEGAYSTANRRHPEENVRSALSFAKELGQPNHHATTTITGRLPANTGSGRSGAAERHAACLTTVHARGWIDRHPSTAIHFRVLAKCCASRW